MSTELYHWGIKGMRWGVRRYQNKDGSLTPAGKKRYEIEDRPARDYDKTVISKGSTVQRVSKNATENDTGRTYISFKKLDNLNYEAMAGEDVLYWTANYDPDRVNDSRYTNNGFKIKLKVTDDIIAPSYNESIDAFVKSVANVPLDELTTRVFGTKDDKRSPYAVQQFKKNTELFVNDMQHITTDECRKRAYDAYSKTLMTSKENQKAFFDELEKRGYNAVIDQNDIKNGFDSPVIVFERSNNLKAVSSTPITDRDKDNALTELWSN